MMKKYIAAAVLSITVLGALAGCGNAGNTGNNAGNAGNVSNAGSAANAGNTEAGTVSGAENGNGSGTGAAGGSGSGTAAGGSDIGSDAALDAALNDAGVAQGDISRLRVTEDRDDGSKVYEVRFNVAEKEYEYEIHAADGTILSSDVERDDDYQAQQNGNTGNANVAVSLDEATKTALDRVPGATEQDIRIKLDYDDGRQKYEGDIIYQQVEYDFEIDADTGEVIEWSEENVRD